MDHVTNLSLAGHNGSSLVSASDTDASLVASLDGRTIVVETRANHEAAEAAAGTEGPQLNERTVTRVSDDSEEVSFVSIDREAIDRILDDTTDRYLKPEYWEKVLKVLPIVASDRASYEVYIDKLLAFFKRCDPKIWDIQGGIAILKREVGIVLKMLDYVVQSDIEKERAPWLPPMTSSILP